jgi:nucleoside phosphorylase/GTPase SAR1 family protein
MTNTIRIEQIRGKIDFAILTIRQDEFKAVLDRFEPRYPVVGGKDLYEYSKILNDFGEEVSVVICRTFEQGHVAAQALANNIITELAPSWLVLAGIAGGFPSKDFSLGDVLLANSIIDYSVSAAIEGKDEAEYRMAGGPMHPAVQRLLAWLPASAERLAEWNHEKFLSAKKPTIHIAELTNDKVFYGPKDFQEKVRESLQHHFPNSSSSRLPLFQCDVLATSNVLVKQVRVLNEWKKIARQISHVEMEMGGVYHAARRSGDKETPLLCIRGISDIVGYIRSEEWTNFACQSAAAFFHAMVRYIPKDIWGDSLPTKFSPVSLLLPTAAPTIEQFLAAFAQSTKTLMSLVVPAKERIERPEEVSVLANLESETSPTVLLLGPPGSGKTCFLAKVMRDAIDNGTAVLAIKADMFPHDLTLNLWGEKLLGLEVSLFDAVKTVSVRQPVLLIIDQLDALASTVDLTSRRLNELIEFIAICGELPGVQVLSSCRDFDFKYDARFRGLNASTISLELPEWEKVEAQLTKTGITGTATWPTKFKELLRTPQHLGVFIRSALETGNVSPFDSYQALLSDFWSRRIIESKERDLLRQLTTRLIQTESLWAPMQIFESQMQTIQALQSKGVLDTSDETIGFAHQTLLEYAKARYFTEDEASLSAFVLTGSRQDSILIRPTIWSVLNYLRQVATAKYELELSTLFESRLRLHLRYLLIDFVIRQDNPSDLELRLIGDRLSRPEERMRILVKMRDKEAWFMHLSRTHFGTVMRSEPSEQWPMIGILSAAWGFAYEDSLSLIKKHWLPRASCDGLTIRAIRECGTWSEDALTIAETLINRADQSFRSQPIEYLVLEIGEANAERAAKLFVNVMRKYEENSASGSSRYESPFERCEGWYELSKLAEFDARGFLEQVWPWAVPTIEKHHSGNRSSVLNVYNGYAISLEEDDGRLDSPILQALLLAIDSVSLDEPCEFLRIVKPSFRSQNRVVHQLIIRGLTRLAEVKPQECLDYLLGDNRRMAVGRYTEARHSDSVELISNLYPLLEAENQVKLVQAIQNWSKYRDDVEMDEHLAKYDREARLHLLNAIPIDLRPVEVTETIAHDKDEFPDWREKRPKVSSGLISQIPPMSKTEMLSASNKAIADAFRTPKLDSAWKERKEVEGGWEEKGDGSCCPEVLGNLTQENPDRGMEIMLYLAQNDLVNHLGPSIRALSESDIPNPVVFEFILEIESFGRAIESFRNEASHLLYQRAYRERGLPDQICEILEQWLGLPWDSGNSTFVEKDSDKEWNGKDSILWAHKGGLLNTDQSFFTLLAFTAGLMNREKPECVRWANVLSSHLDGDVSELTWKTFCGELRWLRISSCDKSISRKLINKLFMKFPSLARSTEGLRLLAHVSSIMIPTELRTLLDRMKSGDDSFCKQGYGELLTLLSFRMGEHDWADEILETEIENAKFGATSEPVLVGIAHASARLWGDFDMPEKAAKNLVRLVDLDLESVGTAANTVFWVTESLAADTATNDYMVAVANHIYHLDSHAASAFLEHASDILPHLGRPILDVCLALTKLHLNELRQMSFDAYNIGPQLVEISMTLQRFQETKSDALSLLEDLLSAGLDDADAMLREVDIQPGPEPYTRPRRSRRRKKR